MNSQVSPARRLRRFTGIALGTILTAAFLVGCEKDPTTPAVGGGAGPVAQPAPSDPVPAPPETSPPDQDPPPSPTPRSEATEIVIPPAPDPQDPESEPSDIPLGWVRLVWTGGTEYEFFEYESDFCFTEPGEILVQGVGGPEGGVGESTINIFAVPKELVHEPTGTVEGVGIIRFTWQGEDIVADGRMTYVGDTLMPATFLYRFEGTTVEFMVRWFQGGAKSGSGKVWINCSP